jgi:hypothetical protein
VGRPLQGADGKVAHDGPRQPTEQGNGHLHIIAPSTGESCRVKTDGFTTQGARTHSTQPNTTQPNATHSMTRTHAHTPRHAHTEHAHADHCTANFDQ